MNKFAFIKLRFQNTNASRMPVAAMSDTFIMETGGSSIKAGFSSQPAPRSQSGSVKDDVNQNCTPSVGSVSFGLGSVSICGSGFGQQKNSQNHGKLTKNSTKITRISYFLKQKFNFCLTHINNKRIQSISHFWKHYNFHWEKSFSLGVRSDPDWFIHEADPVRLEGFAKLLFSVQVSYEQTRYASIIGINGEDITSFSVVPNCIMKAKSEKRRAFIGKYPIDTEICKCMISFLQIVKTVSPELTRQNRSGTIFEALSLSNKLSI